MSDKTKSKILKLGAEYQTNILKARFLKKWRKKIRKTKYLSYKRRLNIYKTDYTSDMALLKLNPFKNVHIKTQPNLKDLLTIHNSIFMKIKFNILLADIAKTQPSHVFWKNESGLNDKNATIETWLPSIIVKAEGSVTTNSAVNSQGTILTRVIHNKIFTKIKTYYYLITSLLINL